MSEVYVVLERSERSGCDINFDEVIYISHDIELATQFMDTQKTSNDMFLIRTNMNKEVPNGLVNETILKHVEGVVVPKNVQRSVDRRLTMEELIDPNFSCGSVDFFDDPLEFGVEPKNTKEPIDVGTPVIPNNMTPLMKEISMYIASIRESNISSNYVWDPIATSNVISQVLWNARNVYPRTSRLTKLVISNSDPSNGIIYNWAHTLYTVHIVPMSNTNSCMHSNYSVWLIVRDILLFKNDSRRSKAFVNVTIRNDISFHANVLLLWKPDKDTVAATLFEPHGSERAVDSVHALQPILDLSGVTYVYVNYIGVQHIENMIMSVQHIDEKGYCALWCIAVIDLFVQFPSIPPPMLITILWTELSTPNKALEFIRKYTTYTRSLLSEYEQNQIIKRIVS